MKDLESRIEAIEKAVAEIRERLSPKSGNVISEPKEKPTQGRYKPEWGGLYFYIDEYGDIEKSYWCESRKDHIRLARGNVYRTEEEAKRADDKLVLITRLNDRIDELNGKWVADWSDWEQSKAFFVIDRNDNKLVIPSYKSFQPLSPLRLMSQSTAEKIKAELTAEEILLLFGE